MRSASSLPSFSSAASRSAVDLGKRPKAGLSRGKVHLVLKADLASLGYKSQIPTQGSIMLGCRGSGMRLNIAKYSLNIY